MKSSDIRSRYLEFFAERGHAIIPSASLVPENDPTVLFNTAGMQPLVPYLMGQPHPLGTRLASAQKCLRTVDIEEVGDNRHCTFFEMLGNWSLGDYFKEDSIAWSWEFLTSSEKGLGLDPQRIYVTVFAGDVDAPKDATSIDLWKEQFVRSDITAQVDTSIEQGGRIFTMPKESNWWGPAGATGPCGPDTEIYYDLGQGELTLRSGFPDFESGRLIEIWNNVFMQLNKNEFGNFEPLVKNNVDTGMGLERITAVVQGVETVFDTDCFSSIIAAIVGALPALAIEIHIQRIMADHLRASVFLVSDGVLPSNKERGYILRRLLRRALLHARSDSLDWLQPVVAAVINTFSQAYPELVEQQGRILTTIQEEAGKFQKTLEQGKREIIKRYKLSGKDAFDLYQSFGFPLELTKEYAKSVGASIDEEEFELEFKRHQDLSRTSSIGQFKSGLADHSEQVVKYHTATHLLHQALKDVLGDQAQQKGSNLNADRLRFDFSYPSKLAPEQITQVENLVNEQIAAALPVSVVELSPAEAKSQGAIGLFGDKYGDRVTVYSIGAYSIEICTGPHVHNTRDLGHFVISKEEAVSAGVRRIKAILE